MIETPRLQLRLPELADVPEAIRFYRDNLEHLRPFSPVFPANHLTDEYWREQVRLRRDEYDAGAGARLFMFTREEPSRIVGNLSLTGVQRGALQQCFLGYGLAAEAQGRGYMLEAVKAAVAFAFEELGLHRVVANYMPHNRRSARVLRDAGFQVEGYFVSYLKLAGRWEDHLSAAIVNPADQ